MSYFTPSGTFGSLLKEVNKQIFNKTIRALDTTPESKNQS